MDSELALQRRYADLTMIIRPERRKYPLKDFILEFKYISLANAELSGEKALAPVKQKLAESKKQLLDYQTRLQSKYGEVLRLQLISVVAVGFERVVWETVSD